MLIDCHAHLDSYSDAEVGEILERGRRVGVGFVVSAGTTLDTSRRSIELSGIFDDFFSGVGIHPMNVTGPVDEATYERLREMALSTEKVVVISEIGLDFMEGAPDRAIQYQAFREQIRLARELRLPVVFHSREAHDEVFRVLREERAYEVGGVMHYFQDDEATAGKAIELGFYVSLARTVASAAPPAAGGGEPVSGEHRAGDGRGAPAVQGEAGELDGAAPPACDRRQARRAPRPRAGGGGGGEQREHADAAGAGMGCRRAARAQRRVSG